MWHEFPHLSVSVINNIGGLQQPIEREINLVYDYLSDCASAQTPQTAIEEFNILFAQSKNERSEVSQALNKIMAFSSERQQFEQFFSNCFYLIFNCWIANSKSLSYTSELFQSIAKIANASSYDRRRKQLIKLISAYPESEAYLKLKAVINIINFPDGNSDRYSALVRSQISDKLSTSKQQDLTLERYIYRYTFLYEYFSPQSLQFPQLNQFICHLKDNHRRDFEIKLSRHIIYRFRLKQVAQMSLLSKGAGKIITKIDNPSLLSERAFRQALQQYMGKIDKQDLLRRSQNFIANNKICSNYKIFKQNLYQFLIQDFKPKNSNYQFEQKLKIKLGTTFTQSDHKLINKVLILQTCRQLLSFIIIESNSHNHSHKFADLVINIGTAQVMMILTKIILICPESKSDLEKKIFLIVHHYQQHSIKDVPWVFKMLEHLLITFGMYFGDIDVCIASSSFDK